MKGGGGQEFVREDYRAGGRAWAAGQNLEHYSSTILYTSIIFIVMDRYHVLLFSRPFVSGEQICVSEAYCRCL